MRVIRNTGQNVSPSDDGRLYDQAFTDGLFNSPSITSLGANLVQIGSMYGILCGRDFTADAQQINVELPTADTATGYIYIKYDTATDDIISVESALAPFTVTYEDINTSGTICEMIIATYTASPVAVTSLTANYPTAQTEVNDTLAGSIAMIETSPATANHSVGDYIVYNGQLNIVTAAITAGTTLNGKITPTTVDGQFAKARIISSGSANSITKSGIYYCTSAVADTPLSGGGVLIIGAYNNVTAAATYISYTTAGAVAYGKRNASGWEWTRTPDLVADTISGITSNSGAIEIPASDRTKLFVNAVLTSHVGFVFQRDASYFTVMNNDLNSAIANTQVTFTAYFFEL